tara:strand:+ start:376 stop:774 length:399 start_codon:yes stop_codon:yes gene_type:complete
MASELKVDKFTGVTTAGSISVTGEGNSTTTNLQQGLNKVWLQYDQSSSTAIQDSFNVASIADNATGKATTTYTNPMNSTSYAIGGCCQGNGFITIPATGPDTDNTGALVTVSNGGSDVDYNHVGPSVKGDLA